MHNHAQPDQVTPWSAALETTMQVSQPSARTEPSIERMLRALEAHAAAEAVALGTYRQLSDTSPDPIVALLVRLVVEDEEHHQKILAEMAGALRRAVTPAEANGTLAGQPAGQARGYPTEAIGAARSLIRDEREGARYLRHLARQEPRMYSGVYPLLLETLARDCEKHGHVLRFILRRLELLWPAASATTGEEQPL